MITKMNEKQEIAMIRCRNKGLQVFFDNKNKINLKIAQEGFNLLYKLAGFNSPTLIECVSIKDALDKIKKMGLYDKNTPPQLAYRGDVLDSYWLVYYKFFVDNFKELTIDTSLSANLDILYNLSVNGNIFSSFQYEGVVFLIEMPSVKYRIIPDGSYQLHCENGKALEWKDGTGYYFLSGRLFNDVELYKDISSKKMSLPDIMKIENMDFRAIALELVNPETLIKSRGVELVEKSLKGNELYNISLPELQLEAQFLHYTCTSTGKHHLKYVAFKGRRDGVWHTASKPDLGTKYSSADLAQALSHNTTLEEYLNVPWEA